MLSIANVTAIAAMLDRGRGLELAWVSELLLDAPTRTTVSGRIAEGPLQRCHRPIHGAFAPTWDAGESILGGRAKSGAILR